MTVGSCPQAITRASTKGSVFKFLSRSATARSRIARHSSRSSGSDAQISSSTAAARFQPRHRFVLAGFRRQYCTFDGLQQDRQPQQPPRRVVEGDSASWVLTLGDLMGTLSTNYLNESPTMMSFTIMGTDFLSGG